MPLQNFVDKVGPVVSASWLNMVDVLSTSVFGNAASTPAARAALCVDNPLEISNGGTGSRSFVPICTTGSFTAQLAGITGPPSGTAYWVAVAPSPGANPVAVMMYIPGFGGASTSIAAYMTGIPANLTPPTLSQIVPLMYATNNGVAIYNTQVQVNALNAAAPFLPSTLSFLIAGVYNSWSGTGTKSIGFTTISWLII